MSPKVEWQIFYVNVAISKYHVTAPFKMQEKKLTMFYIEAHNPLEFK